MKILELRLKNINSLYGEWLIDFQHEEYRQDGIFVLAGPTGAGKSSILDAICLALYGETPRMGNITTSSNEVMSRQTGDCYAEVLFETQEGTYRSRWEQKRARSKAAGKLQPPSHEVAEHPSGTIIEEKKSKVPALIEAKTGMDFKRFTRSMLLAQGSFDSFLRASVDDKSAILEQMTGTEIYTAISAKCFERQRAEEDKLKLLQAELAGISLLGAEEKAALEAQLAELKAGEPEKELAFKSHQEALLWLKSLRSLRAEIAQLEQAHASAQEQQKNFEPEAQRLLRAQRAAQIEAAFASLKAERKLAKDRAEQQKQWAAKLPQLEKASTDAATKLREAETQVTTAKAEQQNSQELFKQVRGLDTQIATQEKALSEQDADIKRDEKVLKPHQTKLKTEQTKQAKLLTQVQAAEDYLSQHAKDEWLVSQLAGLEEQLKSMAAGAAKLGDKQTECEQLAQELRQDTSTWARKNKSRSKQEAEVAKAKAALAQAIATRDEQLEGKLLREYRSEKDALNRELILLNRIADMEAQRGKLEDGCACPLCGALEHPFAHGNIPSPNETEQAINELDQKITQAEQLELRCQEASQKADAADKKLTAALNAEHLAKQQMENSLLHANTQQTELGKMRAEAKTLHEAMVQSLEPLGLAPSVLADTQGLQTRLQTRLDAWLKQQRAKHEAEAALGANEQECTRLSSIIQTAQSSLGSKKTKRKQEAQAIAELQKQRRELFGERSLDEAEKLLQEGVAKAESAMNSQRERTQARAQTWNTAKAQVAQLKQQIEDSHAGLAELEFAWLKQLAAAQFTDESAYSEAQLSVEERDALSQQAQEISKAIHQRSSTLANRQAALLETQAKALTEQGEEELSSQVTTLEQELKELRAQATTCSNALEQEAKAQATIADKREGIEAQQTQYAQWNRLSQLIGSADGKKYRNFAQGLTFEIMVQHANRQLIKMSKRYTLVRDEDEPLKLKVKDNYIDAEARSTDNLSGGERFIVSLALALGLSKMSSHKVRVDSLFLDEGFGTLDSEALEDATTALARLKEDGKLIGIISHVQALKDSIPTQINIANSGRKGRSTISGPGCSAMR